MNKDEWKAAMVRWLCGFPWLWFATLTLWPGLSEAQARWRLDKWIENLRAELGTLNFGYFASREYGKTKHDLHFHVLVMGLRDCGPEARLLWMDKWAKIGGDPLISAFNPGPRGPEYLLKNVLPNDPDAIIIGIRGETQMQTSLEATVTTIPTGADNSDRKEDEQPALAEKE